MSPAGAEHGAKVAKRMLYHSLNSAGTGCDEDCPRCNWLKEHQLNEDGTACVAKNSLSLMHPVQLDPNPRYTAIPLVFTAR